MYKKIVEDYIKKIDFSKFTEGKMQLDGEDYVLISKYNTKENNDMIFEKHEKFIDGFYMLDGEEIVLVSKNMDEITSEYIVEKERLLATVKDYQTVIIKKGDLLILDTDELHKPTLAIEKSSPVVKAIFKIRKR